MATAPGCSQAITAATPETLYAIIHDLQAREAEYKARIAELEACLRALENTRDMPLSAQPPQPGSLSLMSTTTVQVKKRERITLLSLPQELRDSIIRYTLPLGEVIEVSERPSDNQTGSAWSLLRVCSQIRRDAARRFYSENTFSRLANGSDAADPVAGPAQVLLFRAIPRNFHVHLHKLVIGMHGMYLGVTMWDDIDYATRAIIAACPALQSLTMQIVVVHEWELFIRRRSLFRTVSSREFPHHETPEEHIRKIANEFFTWWVQSDNHTPVFEGLHLGLTLTEFSMNGFVTLPTYSGSRHFISHADPILWERALQMVKRRINGPRTEL